MRLKLKNWNWYARKGFFAFKQRLALRGGGCPIPADYLPAMDEDERSLRTSVIMNPESAASIATGTATR